MLSRDQKTIIALAVSLFLACNAITCLGGLVVGGTWTAMMGRWAREPPHPAERDSCRPPSPLEPRREPERMPVAALVTEITEDSPAERAGLKPGDLILAVDGEQIQRDADLRETLSAYQPGDRIELTVRRGDRERDIQVSLGRHPDDQTWPYLGVTYWLVPIVPE